MYKSVYAHINQGIILTDELFSVNRMSNVPEAPSLLLL